MKNFRNLFGLVLGRVGSSSPSLLAGWQPASTTETDRTPSLPLPHLPAPVAPPPFRGAQTVFFRRNKGGAHVGMDTYSKFTVGHRVESHRHTEYSAVVSDNGFIVRNRTLGVWRA